MEQLNPPAIIGEAVAGQQSALRKRMLLLAQDLTKNTFDLAEAFLQAQESRCYMEWGFESLGDYAALELGIKHRKAQYLARIVRVCRECGIARKDYQPIGVSKLREITSLDPDTTFFNADTKEHEPMVDHIVELVANAPELSTIEVETEVARLKGMTGENSMVLRVYKVTRSAWDHVVEPCFEAIRKRMGSAGRDTEGKAKEFPDGKVIENLCAEYNADPRNFMEEPDESGVQIEVQEESNGITNEYTSGGTPVQLDSEEIPQDTLCNQQEPFVLPSEDNK